MNTLDSLRAALSVSSSRSLFSYVIAVGTSEQEIEADWAWLEENLLGMLGERGEGRKGVGGRGGGGKEGEEGEGFIIFNPSTGQWD